MPPSSPGQTPVPEIKAATAVQLTTEQFKAIAQDINRQIARVNGKFSVTVDDTTGRMVTRILDSQTGEIVKQIPPQQLLEVSVSVEQIIGLLINNQL